MKLRLIQALYIDEHDPSKQETLIVEWRDIDGGVYLCFSDGVLTGKGKDASEAIRDSNSKLKKETAMDAVCGGSLDHLN